MIGNNVNFVNGGVLRIHDSYKLLPLTLATLGSQIVQHPTACVYQQMFANGRTIKGKGEYPYDWMDTCTKMNDTEFPPYDAFANTLGEHVDKDDNDTATAMFYQYFCNFKQYHNFYLQMDCAILLDILLYQQNQLWEVSELYLLSAQTMPQFAIESMKKMSLKS